MGDIMANKKVFISQLMADRKKEDILEEREKIIESLKEKVGNFEVLDNIFEDDASDNVINKSVYCLGKSISLLSEADIAVFGKDWFNGRGTLIEHKIAEEYGIAIIKGNNKLY